MTTTSKTLTERLAAGETLIGTFHDLVDPNLIEIIGASGFDFVILEHEHGLRDVGRLQELIRAADVAGIPALIRVGGATENLMEQLLDGGAAGFVLPHVTSKEQLEQIVRWCKYPPDGTRGSGFARGLLRQLGEEELRRKRKVNTQVAIFAIIEHQLAVDNIEEIVQATGLTGILPGPGDLALELGFPRWDHPEVTKRLDHVRQAVSGTERTLMSLCMDPSQAPELVRAGSRMLLLNHDVHIIRRAYEDVLTGIRAALK